MAFLPGFDFDIFISYARPDDFTFDTRLPGWVDAFRKNLKSLLDRDPLLEGRMGDLKIWWDNTQMEGNTFINESIQEGVRKSAILICLNSPTYLKSNYCTQERDIFHKKAQTEKVGLKVGNRSRIFNVLIYDIPIHHWPAELTGTLGFKFFKDRDTLYTNSVEYIAEITNLKNAVIDTLMAIQVAHQEQTQQPVKKEEPENEFTIFFGEVADTLSRPKKRILAELEKKGFTVTTGIPPPHEEEAHERMARLALERSHLAVHLLDQFPGHEIIGAREMWYPQKQAELTLQSGKPQMFCVPADLDFETIEDEKYKVFLQGLEKENAPIHDFQFIRQPLSSMSQVILDYAEELKTKHLQQKADPGKYSVLLDTHFKDQMYAFDLGRVLLENQIQPFINPLEDDPRKNSTLLGDRISQVKKLVVLYGHVSKGWVYERINATLQLIIEKGYPIEEFFVYMAPPHKEANDISIPQRLLKITVVDSSNHAALNAGILHQFVNDLKTGIA